LLLAGCESLLGIEDFSTDGVSPDGSTNTTPGDGDNPIQRDGDTGDEVPRNIRISGEVFFDNGAESAPLPSTAVHFVRLPSTIVDTVTDANGKFAVEVASIGPLDGFIDVDSPPNTFKPRAYVFDATTDRTVFTTAFDPDRLALLAAAGGVEQSESSGAIILSVIDNNGAFAPGATVTASSGAVRYHDNANDAPSTSRTSTDNFGIVWVFVVEGNVTLTAHIGARSITRTVTVGRSRIVSLLLDVP
jgi:hypothetical protein